MSQCELLEKEILPQFKSVQPPELHVLSQACHLFKGKSANIYTEHLGPWGGP